MPRRTSRVESPVGRVYTTAQVGQILQISPRMVQWLIQRGRLKALRVGHSYRILEGDLQAFCGYAPPASDTLGSSAAEPSGRASW